MKTIMIVEDNPQLRTTIRYVLQREFRVIAVGTAEEACDQAADVGEEIDGIIVDYVLPDANGVDLFIRLRTLLPDVRVAMLTGLIPEDPRVRKVGFADIKHKPISGEQLLTMARKVTA